MEAEVRSFSPELYLKSHLFIISLLILSLFAIGMGAFSVLSLGTSVPTASPDVGVAIAQASPELVTRSMVIDIEGQVLHPGIVHFDVEANVVLRLADVIERVGGVTQLADADYIAKNLNLASIVTDGMKLYIPKRGEVLGASSTNIQSTGNLINVNSASIDELEKLTGIGQVRAQTIIDNRPYSSIEELKAKTKLSAAIDKVKTEIGF